MIWRPFLSHSPSLAENPHRKTHHHFILCLLEDASRIRVFLAFLVDPFTYFIFGFIMSLVPIFVAKYQFGPSILEILSHCSRFR